jgi:hypothetical protein
MELDGRNVWAVYDPFECEEVLFESAEDALKFIALLTEDLELDDHITISLKAVRVAKESDIVRDPKER